MILIVTCGRFHELDLELATICYNNNVKFIFVRTKFDRDVQEAYRTLEDEIEDFSRFSHGIQKRLKVEFYAQLKGFKPPLYFINGLRLGDYAFPQLLKNVARGGSPPMKLRHTNRFRGCRLSKVFVHLKLRMGNNILEMCRVAKADRMVINGQMYLPET